MNKSPHTTYQAYRSYGHTILASYMLSSGYQPFIVAAIIGILLGLIIE